MKHASPFERPPEARVGRVAVPPHHRMMPTSQPISAPDALQIHLERMGMADTSQHIPHPTPQHRGGFA
jgi:hypothetical protein